MSEARAKVILPGDNSESTGKKVVTARLAAPTSAMMRQRRELIASTVEAFGRLQPAYMRACVDYLQKITKVQTRKWRQGYGELKVQLPQDLFLTLRRIFHQVFPEEPCFGDLESDIDMLTEIAPALMPPIGGARANRGKKSR